MRSIYTQVLTAVIILTSLGIGHSAQAGFFYTEYLVHGPYNLDDVGWIYFGGCEDLNKSACESNHSSNLIGDYSVKQGAYAVTEANDEHVHGKLVLSYQYRFLTEEDEDNTTDIGYIKLKDIETNTIYYLATYTAIDKTKKWQDVRIALSNDLVNLPLQLVAEVENDGERLSTMDVQNISLKHYSEPVIRGTVYGPEQAGVPNPLEGVTIKLQNRSRTKTYAETTTVVQSDTTDTYTFWPVPRNKKFTIVASYGGEEKTINVRKMMWGSYRADEDFIFD